MEKANHLAHSNSPYLLQHQFNPVDWYPWSEEAIEKAKREDKPLFLSIGYLACHWCHVMERESFASKEIAALLNAHFVSIKVDREERPDIDRLYMAAVQGMTGHGGWPMTLFLTPSLEPFFAGTYFPPMTRMGMLGFKEILEKISIAWREERPLLTSSAQKIGLFLREEEKKHPLLKGALSDALFEALKTSCSAAFDSRWGGFDAAPKFPQAGTLLALLKQFRRDGDPQTLFLVTHTLDQMARGGIFDQIGGGFHRYSVDERWLVPHFEKMLYDNALLSQLYLQAYQVTKKELYLNVALKTLDFILDEMQGEEGGFLSAFDADSQDEEGECKEGEYYIWTAEQILSALGADDAKLFCDYYGVKPQGNFEGRTVLWQAKDIEEASPDEREILSRCRKLLYNLRSKRQAPLADDKIIVEWSSLAISSLAKGYQVTGKLRYLQQAQKALDFVTSLYDRGHLPHFWRRGHGEGQGFLSDYAALIQAQIDLYESDFDLKRLLQAKALAERLIALFWDQDAGAFFDSSAHHNSPLLRTKSFSDDPTPSGNAQAACALLRLAAFFGQEGEKEGGLGNWPKMAEQTLAMHVKAIEQASRWYGYMLCSIDLYLSSLVQIVLVGAKKSPLIAAFLKEIRSRSLPHIVALKESNDERLEIFKGKEKEGAYLCYRFTCLPLIEDPSELAQKLSEFKAN